MPRPRFARLEIERRDAIFEAASIEFGEHGFSRASYNRIIERAGLSKGAMYYYFDDKRDLFATVIEDAVDRLFEMLKPMEPVADADAFWESFAELSTAAWAGVMSTPRIARLLPALIDPRNASDVPETMERMIARVSEWIQQVLGRGREVGAVRDDLPDDLLLAVTMGVGEGIDRWIARRLGGSPSEPPPDELKDPGELMQTMVGLMRRLLAP